MNVGDYSNITSIFEKDDSCIINLMKSYRSTMEITKFSRGILNNEVTSDYVERRGEKPTIIGFTDEELITERILADVKKYKNSGYNSIGIITRTTKEAKKVYTSLKDTVDVKAIFNDNDEYVSGIVVIPAYLAKGLEFDVVILYNAGEEEYSGDNDRLLLYTACTRALHILCIYYLGKISPLLKEIYYRDKII